MDFLRQNAALIAAWMPLMAVAVAVATLVACLRAKTRGWRLLWSTLMGNAVIALIVMLGPMAPLFSSARKLNSWRGHAVPSVVFQDVATGRRMRMEDLRGRVVVVNIWATWCPPCRQEMPALNQLQKAYAARGVTVLTLTDEEARRVTPFLARFAPDTVNGITSFEWLPVQKFRPFTFVIDRQGIVRRSFFGSQTLEAFEKAIGAYL